MERLGHVLGGQRERQDGGVGGGLDRLHGGVVFLDGRLEDGVAGRREGGREPVGCRPVGVRDGGDVSGCVGRREQRVETHPLAVGCGLAHGCDRLPHTAGHVDHGARRQWGVLLDRGPRDRHRDGHTDHVEALVGVGRDGAAADGPGSGLGGGLVGVGEGERRVGVVPERPGDPPPHRARADDENVHRPGVARGVSKGVRSPAGPEQRGGSRSDDTDVDARRNRPTASGGPLLNAYPSAESEQSHEARSIP